ncbi:MAG: DUF2955 domain-containing protein [Pseudomonas sp.]|uniref:DUF2955 domain-containing protein n=1 Tax=Pseudomonas sp. TaxID=306 RepID=UPI003393ED8F
MSIDSLELSRRKRQGLRIALAVACGLSVGMLMGETLPFFAPLIAIQLLFASRSPLGLRQGLATILLVVGVGALLVLLTDLFGEEPEVLVPSLWLCYFGCFWAQGQGKGGAAPSLILIIAIVVPMLDIQQRDLGDSIALILARGISGGILLTWAAHALLPDRPADTSSAQPPAPRPALRHVTRQALASATILLLIVTFCLVDPRLATAMVIPITVSSLLSQLESTMTQRAALALLVVNLLGGIVASLACTLVQLRPTLWLLFLTALLVGLLFAGRAVSHATAGKLFAGGLTTFLILFGLGISPLPASSPELFSTRMAYVLFAVIYALFMTLLLWPGPRREYAGPSADDVHLRAP